MPVDYNPNLSPDSPGPSTEPTVSVWGSTPLSATSSSISYQLR